MIPRTLGENIALSVPTAGIFETTLNEDLRARPDGLIINGRTLWRNYWTSWKESERPLLKDIYEEFFEEVETIMALLNGMKISYMIYWPEYKNLDIKLPGSVLKTKKTDSVKAYEATEDVIGKQMIRRRLAISIDTLMPSANGNAWLITHLPIDLLNRYQFTSLKLLQSHTGKIIDPVNWNKTIFATEKYRRMPFNSFTLSIFGDRSKQFAGHSIKVRKRVFDLATDRKWTPLTTLEKIRYDLQYVESGEIKDIMIRALDIYLK